MPVLNTTTSTPLGEKEMEISTTTTLVMPVLNTTNTTPLGDGVQKRQHR